MILLIHIIVAFTSLLLTAYTCLAPSKARIVVAYGFAGATLLSGIVLMFESPSQLVRACIAGLTYFAIVGFGIAYARQRLTSLSSLQQ